MFLYIYEYVYVNCTLQFYSWLHNKLKWNSESTTWHSVYDENPNRNYIESNEEKNYLYIICTSNTYKLCRQINAIWHSILILYRLVDCFYHFCGIFVRRQEFNSAFIYIFRSNTHRGSRPRLYKCVLTGQIYYHYRLNDKNQLSHAF